MTARTVYDCDGCWKEIGRKCVFEMRKAFPEHGIEFHAIGHFCDGDCLSVWLGKCIEDAVTVLTGLPAAKPSRKDYLKLKARERRKRERAADKLGITVKDWRARKAQAT